MWALYFTRALGLRAAGAHERIDPVGLHVTLQRGIERDEAGRDGTERGNDPV
jgi:hypothetical protein